MRNDLSAINGISEVVTNLDEKTVTFHVVDDVDVTATLNTLVEANDKLSDWEFVE